MINIYDDKPRPPQYPPHAPDCEVKKDIDPKEADRKMINAFTSINCELINLDKERRMRVVKAVAILNDVEL